MRWGPLLLAAALLGCAHPRSQVQAEDDFDFPRLHRLAVVAFTDSRGHGREIAQGINDQLPAIMHEAVDMDAVQQILGQYKPDRNLGLGLEALELVRKQTSADAIILGSVSPDWSTVMLTVVETDLGNPVLRAALRPRDKKKAAFGDVKEIVTEALRVLLEKR